ncbi:MAG: hypothetical protein KG075_02635 [Alphaproteobacteria bacterium]|nr:hypothetical protein [Alphaproteobacteria bacterium]
MPPQTPPSQTAPEQPIQGAQPGAGHEPPAFESDLDRHRASVDEVYGSHGVQPDPAEETAFRPGSGRGSRGMSRVGDRRRR